jgi:hypothetical protein
MTFVSYIADVQALVLGAVFAWAGVWKVFSPQAHKLARQSALVKLLPGPGMAQAFHVAVGISEIIVAVLLLLPPERWWATRLASALAVGFLAYLALVWKVAPEKPCACMGGRATQISRRSVARAGGILLLTALAWTARAYWGASLVVAPWLGLVILAELLALWVISPEFGSLGVSLERRLVRAARLRLNPSCEGITLDWPRLETELQRTGHYSELARYISSPADRWREECVGFIAYHARFENQSATAVFTFPVLYDSAAVAAALVDDASHVVLQRLAAARS